MNKKETFEARQLEAYFKSEDKETVTKKVKITFDGKQFSIKIPSKMAKIMKVNKEDYCFEFELFKPHDIDEEPRLTGKLKKW